MLKLGPKNVIHVSWLRLVFGGYLASLRWEAQPVVRPESGLAAFAMNIYEPLAALN